jgi:hypothetical protein
VEKTSLEAAKADAEMKVKELDKQKHDRETLAELAVAKKEVEALKVTVTQMEEERESKGSQQLGELEGRVTELDQKLWEATQSEAAVKVELDCYKRLAQFQKVVSLAGLGVSMHCFLSRKCGLVKGRLWMKSCADSVKCFNLSQCAVEVGWLRQGKRGGKQRD